MSFRQMALVAIALAVSAPVAAQQGRGHTQRGPMPAQLLKLKMTLELSDDQIAQLEELQSALGEQRAAQMEEARALRQQAMSGDATPNELREQMASRREAMREKATAHRQMIEQVLTDEQRGKLAELREAGQKGQAGKAGMRGRRGRGPQQGMRGSRGQRGHQRSFRRGGGRRGGPPLRGNRRGGGLG
jgi:Spy/CpxP family protein refolding chaperone